MWTGVAQEGSIKLDEIRAGVQGALGGIAPGNADLWRMVQAVDELASNCMRHAYGIGTPGPISIEVSSAGQRITVVITDKGKLFEGSLDRPLDLAPTIEGRFGGLGLALTKLVVNEMRYERTGPTNRWTVMLDLAQPPKSTGRPLVPA